MLEISFEPLAAEIMNSSHTRVVSESGGLRTRPGVRDVMPWNGLEEIVPDVVRIKNKYITSLACCWRPL